MSAHTRRKAQRKYKHYLLSERESNQPSISTAMFVAGRMRQLRECRKVDAAQAQTNAKQNFHRLLPKAVYLLC